MVRDCWEAWQRTARQLIQEVDIEESEGLCCSSEPDLRSRAGF